MPDLPIIPLKVVEQAYGDVLQPAAKEVGSVLSRAVRAALSPARAALWSWEKAEQWAEAAAEQWLERRQVPVEHIVPPPVELQLSITAALQIAGPAEDPALREMFAGLLASGMDREVAESVHPAFVEILRQVTPQEARVLTGLHRAPLTSSVSISSSTTRTDGRVSYTPASPPPWTIVDRELGVQIKISPAMKNNLMRLGLVVESTTNYTDQRTGAPRGNSHTLGLSAFGTSLVRACVAAPSGVSPQSATPDGTPHP
jgi:hypothetical protein